MTLHAALTESGSGFTMPRNPVDDGTMPMRLSIVSTLYRSAPHLDEFYTRAVAAARQLTEDFEIILVNDGSPDDSLAVALRLYQADPRVRVVDLARNFGHHKAMMTGLEHARGELVFLLDSDLEEQPEWLGEFNEVRGQTGADVVYGVQSRRKGDWFERSTGAVYFGIFNKLLDHPLPRNVVTARLMTRRYVRSLVQHRDREICMAGLWVLTGFEQVAVPVNKLSRGRTTYSVRKRISVLVNSVTSFSNRPLVYIFYLGCVIMSMAALAGFYLIVRAIVRGSGVPGWPSLIVSIWFLGGLTIFCLGVIGIYVAKVFMETKDRPYTIVRAEYTHSAAGTERVR
jgi:putative glycosyltransferase